MQFQRFIIYELKHTSKEIVVKFKEKKGINTQVTLYTEMFAPVLNRKVAIVDVAQDFLNKVGSSIADNLIIKVKDPLVPQLTKANVKFTINFPIPIIFAKHNAFTEIIGFDAEVESEMFTVPSELKNISEYKDIVQQRTYALVYEVEYDGETYKLLKKN